MATNGLERRIDRLERELGAKDEKLVVAIRRFSDGDLDGELQEVQCGGLTLARRYDETEDEFRERAATEAILQAGEFNPCAVMFETKRCAPMCAPITTAK